MDRKQLKETLVLFSPLGDSLKARSMFGGFGLFVDDTMFAILLDDGVALRSNDNLLPQYQALGMQPYRYQKKGFPVTTSYYLIDEQTRENFDQVLILAKQALHHATIDKKSAEKNKVSRLKDLPNMRLATERMLKKAGIQTVDDLKQQGASSAFSAIKQSQALEPKLELLWALEGAIKGSHWSLVSSERRQQLLSQVN